MVVEAVLDTKKEETIENWTKALRVNAISLIQAIRGTEVEKIKSLILQLRRLERQIYRRVRRDKNLSHEEKKKLRKWLAEMQAIYYQDRHQLKANHMSSLRILAGEEEKISEEMLRNLQEELSKSTWEQAQEKIKESFKEILNSLESGDIIGVSYAGSSSDFGKAAQVFEVATGSKVSHVGIIDVRKDWFGGKKIYVIEASEVVTFTPIQRFILSGGGRIAIYRYKKGLTEKEKETLIKKARSWGKEWYQFWKKAKHYDYFLSPGDEELYCSELVDEAYKAVGIQLSNKYWSVDSFYKKINLLFSKGAFELYHGLKFRSTEEALSRVVGDQAYYKLPKDGIKFRESIVTPQDVIINTQTKKIFDNLT